MTLASRSVRVLAAVVSGALLASAFPGAGIDLVALVALAPLVAAVLRARRGWEAFLLGCAGLLVTWLINVPWVIAVMVTHGGIPFAVGVSLYVAMCLVLCVYGGLFAFGVWRARELHPVALWFAVAAIWAAVEYLRTYLLTGFPWNLIAVALIDSPVLIVLARVIGPYGIGWLAMVPASALGWILATSGRPKLKITAVVSAAALLVCWAGAGAILLRRIDPAEGEPFRAAMLQPDISTEMRWSPETTFLIYERMMRMTEEAADAGASVIVWPESTVPLTFLRHEFYRRGVEEISARRGADIILGSVAEDDQDAEKIWNAAYLVHEGETKGRYDKLHLVPFGEYVPLRRVIFFAEKLVRAVGEFQFGTNDRPLGGKHRYGPAICYEAIFPQITSSQVRSGADVLVTITNDGWFDRTAAPRQHLDAARLRAVETDRWLLRAATTGISAVVDPAGRTVEELEVGRQGTIVADVTARQSQTVYVRFGDWIAWVACATATGAVLLPWWRRRRRLNKNSARKG